MEHGLVRWNTDGTRISPMEHEWNTDLCSGTRLEHGLVGWNTSETRICSMEHGWNTD